ncbi:MAG: hypothetical protein GC203_13305 [Phenylobacterium sp.]|uniref:hypothetical protein n=1 Tax=Phenylobacterium sp. TaxID=1871053 RepID=UPI0025D82F76|nr:hypothetical protein [Phenylobacterium sp.]MBI1198832.1 hypothetical protein [Phenylobacterium sp.]
MRNTLLALALGGGVGLIVGAGLAAAGSRPGARPSESSAIIPFADGLYTIADRSVTCRVNGGWIACANGRVTIACKNDQCRANYYHDDYPDELHVLQSDEQAKHAKVLRPGGYWDLGRMGCHTSRTHIECDVMDFNGGFQMSGLFSRNVDWNDAPPGWPWDGRTYTEKDRMPGV